MTKPIAQDIITLPVEVTSKITDSKFRLVHIASQRVRQLADGDQPEVMTRSIKDTTIALEESLTGKFTVVVGEEARVAKEAYRKRQEQARIEEQLSAKEEEIRKELTAYLSESHAEELADEGDQDEPSDLSEEAPAEEAEEAGEAGEE